MLKKIKTLPLPFIIEIPLVTGLLSFMAVISYGDITPNGLFLKYK